MQFFEAIRLALSQIRVQKLKSFFTLLGVMIGVTFLIGLWVIAFGFLTPGGGFQGGVVVAGAILLVFLTAGYRAW